VPGQLSPAEIPIACLHHLNHHGLLALLAPLTHQVIGNEAENVAVRLRIKRKAVRKSLWKKRKKKVSAGLLEPWQPPQRVDLQLDHLSPSIHLLDVVRIKPGTDITTGIIIHTIETVISIEITGEAIEEATVQEPNVSVFTVNLKILRFVFIVGLRGLSGKKTDPSLAIVALAEGDTMSTEEGLEFQIDSREQWEALVLGRGDIVEVHLPSTNHETSEDLWAAFWVRGVAVLPDGSYAVPAKSIGCSNPDWTRYFSNALNRKLGRLHVCSNPSCEVEGHVLHVRRLKVFSAEGFYRPYMSPYIKTQMKKWAEDSGDEGEMTDTPRGEGTMPPLPGAATAREEFPPPPPGDMPLAGGAPHREEGPDAPAGRPRGPRPGALRAPTRDVGRVTEEERAKLRERLASARDRMMRGGVEGGAGTAAGRTSDLLEVGHLQSQAIQPLRL